MPDGAFVEFGGLNEVADWKKWQGRGRDAFIFDEATEFAQIQVRSLIGWLRTTRPGQRVRIILTFNPPTDEEGKWVTRLLAPWLDREHPNPAQDGDIRWFAMLGEQDEWKEVDSGESFEHRFPNGRIETVHPFSVTFIRARVSDNPFLGEEYLRSLMSLPEPLRSQVLHGDFNADQKADPWQVIPTAWVQAAQKRFRERVSEYGSIEAAIRASAPRLTALGVDTAHGGGDKMVVAPRYIDFIAPLKKIPGKEVPDGKSAAPHVVDSWEQGASVNVDAIGYGATAAEKLADSPEDGGYGIPNVNAVNVGSGSTYTDKSGKYKMRNLRIELYWRLRDALDPDNNPTLCLPDDRELLADLCAPKFKVTPNGLQMESKEDLRKRIARSPDTGDAVVLTLYDGGGGWEGFFDAGTQAHDQDDYVRVSEALAVDW